MIYTYRFLVVVLFLISLIGCSTPLVNQQVYIYPVNDDDKHKKFMIPDLDEPPILPEISEDKIGDYEHLSKILYEHIQNLNVYIQDHQDFIKKEYKKYLRNRENR